MRIPSAVFAALLASCLAGCVFRGKPVVKPAVVTPAAAPAPAAPAPSPPAPLSMPQTNVQLPEPQPLSDEAVASTQPPDEPPLPPMPPRAAPTRRPSVSAAPKPAMEPQGPVAPQPLTPEPDRQPVQEVVSPGDQKKFQEEAEDYKRQIKRYLDQAQNRRLNSRQISTRDYINTFVKQSDEFQARGDMRQAKELAGRALALAKELLN